MKTLIITGASRGIGLATAELFLAKGWEVINLSRTPCPLEDVLHLGFDLNDPDWGLLTDLFDAHFSAPQPICLVHNAAINVTQSLTDTQLPRLKKACQANIITPTGITQAITPYMANGSSVLYIGSTLSEKAIPGCYPYVVTKHASIGMMRATCQDLADHPIHTACLCPGMTDTQMFRDHAPKDPKILEQMKAMVSANRFITPDEIASVVYFAAEHPVVNGTVLHANLGQLER